MADSTEIASHKEAPPKRPILVTIVAGLSAVFLTLGFVGGLSWARASLVDEFSAMQVNAMLAYMPIGIIASLGIWRMKRWGVYLYAAFSVVGHATNFAVGIDSGVAGYVSTIVVLGVAAMYFRRMA